MEEDNNNQRFAKLKWFFYIIVIPFLFTLIIFSIILTVAGIDIEKETKNLISKIPFAEAVADNNRNDKLIETLQTKENNLNEKLQVKEEEIVNLGKQLEEKEKKILSIENELQALRMEKENEENIATSSPEMLIEMDAEIAAGILSELTINEAFLMINRLPAEVSATILEEMEVGLAAEIMKKMSLSN